ncbi:MAG: hypothetical protein ACI8RZ_007441 [Myxococcota bacterium]
MADLVTHAAVGLLIKATTSRRHAAVFVAGTLLPDLLSRLPSMVCSAARVVVEVPSLLIYGWDPLHTPAGMLLSSYAISLLFTADQRRGVFLNLLGGMLLHMAVDLLQSHLGVGYPLLFPFSTRAFELGLIGSEATVPLAIPLAALAVFVWRRGQSESSLSESSGLPML